MKKNIFIAVFIAIALIYCSPAKKTTVITESKAKISSTQQAADGLSYTTAIVITETSETNGVHAEYAWIKAHYSDYTIKGQSLNYHDKKPFDIINIQLSDNTERKLYFDISNFYGKL